MAEPIDEYFTTTVSALSGSARQRSHDDAVRDGSSLTARPVLGAVRRCNSAAATSTWPPAGCGRRARATTPSARRAMRAMRRWRPRCGPPIPRCCTIAPVASSSPAPPRSTARPVARRAARDGGGHRGTDRRRAAQGVRPPRPEHHSADLDHRISPSAGYRRRVLDRAQPRKLGVACPWPDDAITVCSFGDASVNHSTAVGAINAALHSAYQGVPMPLLFVCEDNGIGISVKTPRGWIEQTYGNRDGLRVFRRRRLRSWRRRSTPRPPPPSWVRTHRRPAFLHLRMVRLMGHAGSDYEPAYRRPEEISRRLRPRSGAVHRESVDRPRAY